MKHDVAILLCMAACYSCCHLKTLYVYTILCILVITMTIRNAVFIFINIQ